jgi:site-specific recombinase XerD
VPLFCGFLACAELAIFIGRAETQKPLTIPAGQSSHALRHTFASYFVMNGGSILTLQKILGAYHLGHDHAQ